MTAGLKTRAERCDVCSVQRGQRREQQGDEEREGALHGQSLFTCRLRGWNPCWIERRRQLLFNVSR
jgi:hypothetical protein